VLEPGDGGGQPVAIDAEELRSLAKAARSARSAVEYARSRITGIIGPLDRRGWNAGAADGTWSRARSGLMNLETDLEQHAARLERRANLVDRFEEMTAGDPNGWVPILPLASAPNAADPYAIIDLSNGQGAPWNIALDGLQLVLSAMDDAPSDCNDAFLRIAQAVSQGPDAVRDALARNRPGCNESRSLIRLSGLLADGTPVDMQAEATLNQFVQQMTAAADGLGGESGGSRPRPIDSAEGAGSRIWQAGDPLPNAHSVEIATEKFERYSMDPSNLGNEGKWKAFEALGYDVQTDAGRASGAEDVISQLNSQLASAPANADRDTAFGPRFHVETMVTGPNGKSARLVTIWQIDQGASAPRMITNWLEVLKEGGP
jgi:hypothetical protein